MKKIIALALVLCTVALCFIGCGKDDPKTEAKLAIEKYFNPEVITKIDTKTVFSGFSEIAELKDYEYEDSNDEVILVYKDVDGKDTYLAYNVFTGKTVLTLTDTDEYGVYAYCDSDNVIIVEKDYGFYYKTTFYTDDGVELTTIFGDDYDDVDYFEAADLYVIDNKAFRVEDGKATEVFNFASLEVLASATTIFPIGENYVAMSYTGSYPSMTMLFNVFDKDFKFVGNASFYADQMYSEGVVDGKVFLQYDVVVGEEEEEYTCYRYNSSDELVKVVIKTVLFDPATLEITYVEDLDFVCYEMLVTNEVMLFEGVKSEQKVLNDDAILAWALYIEDGILNINNYCAFRTVALNSDFTVKEDLTMYVGMNFMDFDVTDKLFITSDITSDNRFVYDRATGACIAVVDEDHMIGNDYYYVYGDGIYAFVGEDGTYNKKIYDFTQSLVESYDYNYNGCMFFFTEKKPGDGTLVGKRCMFCDGKVTELYDVSLTSSITYSNKINGLYEIYTLNADLTPNYQLVIAKTGTVVASGYSTSISISGAVRTFYANNELGSAAVSVAVLDGTFYLIK